MNITGPALAEGPETARIRAFLDGAGAAGSRTDPAVTVTLPAGDDAAAFRAPAGAQVVVSCDASVEGVHFRREWMTWETIGYRAAASALSDLERGLEPDPGARRAFDRPRPRIEEMLWLRERVRIHAAIDLSDGVMRDARHLAAASRVALEVEADRLPAAPALEGFRHAPAAERLLLAGGEDYELLLAVPAGAMQGTERAFAVAFDLPLTRIGSVREGEGLTVSGRLNPALPEGFDHFEAGR